MIRQLIVFKFKTYTDHTPSNLFWAAAILIKHKFLSHDIYNELLPESPLIQQQYRKFLNNLQGKSRFKRKVMVGELSGDGRRESHKAAVVEDEGANVSFIK